MDPGRVRPLLLVLSLPYFAGGCAAGARGHARMGDVTVAVHNPSESSVDVRVCAPAGCLPPRAVAAGREEEFRFPSEGGTRAVVTAKRGDRVIEQQAVDFRRGMRYHVVLDVP